MVAKQMEDEVVEFKLSSKHICTRQNQTIVILSNYGSVITESVILATIAESIPSHVHVGLVSVGRSGRTYNQTASKRADW